jgi:hypothetical protein
VARFYSGMTLTSSGRARLDSRAVPRSPRLAVQADASGGNRHRRTERRVAPPRAEVTRAGLGRVTRSKGVPAASRVDSRPGTARGSADPLTGSSPLGCWPSPPPRYIPVTTEGATASRPVSEDLEAMMLRDAQGCPGTTSLASWAFASSYISSEGVFMPNQTVTFRSWSPTIVSTRHLETCGAG